MGFRIRKGRNPVNTLTVGTESSLMVVGGVPNDNQISLPGGKCVVKVLASSPVIIGVYGPFPGGVVDPALKQGKDKLKICGTNVQIGNNAVSAQGNYLVEINAPTSSTVTFLVRKWTFFDNFWQYQWKVSQPNKC